MPRNKNRNPFHMKKIKDAIISTVATIVVLFLSGWLCVMGSITLFKLTLLGECLSWECAPKRPFTVVDLGLPSKLFPIHTIYNSIEYRDDDNAATLLTGYQKFQWENEKGGGTYTVDMYSSNRTAFSGFKIDKNATFFSNWGETKVFWSKPEELTYESPLADDFFMACSKISIDDLRCGAIGRYQEFVIFTSVTLNGGMNFISFQEIVIYMDKQISNYLYGK